MNPIGRIRELLRLRRRTVATAVGLVGVAVVGSQLSAAAPREVDVAYRWEGRQDVQEVRIAYVFSDGEEVAGARFVDPGARLSHRVRLAPGRYRVEAFVRAAEREWTVRRALRVPTDGRVLIDLTPASPERAR